MAASFETLSQRIFNDAHELTPPSPCPTMDVVLLAASSGEKLGLWRVAGRAGLVWSKERAGVSVESFCWSPDGHVIAVTRQHQQSGDGEGEAAPATELELCSVHDCSPVAPKVLLPQFSGAASPSQSHSKRKKKSNAACLAWLQLPEQPLKAIEAEDLIRRLPALGSVPKKNPADKSKTPASMYVLHSTRVFQHPMLTNKPQAELFATALCSVKLSRDCSKSGQLQARCQVSAVSSATASPQRLWRVAYDQGLSFLCVGTSCQHAPRACYRRLKRPQPPSGGQLQPRLCAHIRTALDLPSLNSLRYSPPSPDAHRFWAAMPLRQAAPLSSDATAASLSGCPDAGSRQHDDTRSARSRLQCSG